MYIEIELYIESLVHQTSTSIRNHLTAEIMSLVKLLGIKLIIFHPSESSGNIKNCYSIHDFICKNKSIA